MDSANLFSALLQDPETMQKLSGIAAELMNGTAAPVPEVPQSPPAPQDHLTQRILPALSGIAAQAQKPHNPARHQLLHALRPFLSEDTCAQIAHAEHILSMAQATRAAAEQLLVSGQREV